MTEVQTELLLAVAHALKGLPSSSGIVELDTMIAAVEREVETEAVDKAYRERT